MTYDTGFVRDGRNSRAHFDPAVVRRELTIIRDDLHCNAVQIIGGDPDRLEQAATDAAGLGMEVWFSPYPLELEPGEMLQLFAECAVRAERLRQDGAEVVFVTGVEISLMNRGLLPGDTLEERLDGLISTESALRQARFAELSTRVNDFLRDAVTVVRDRFKGRVTYAAVPLEQVDWSRFDIVSLELIRSAEVAEQFAGAVRALVDEGKPVAITGFGTSAYQGAGDRGGRAMEIVEYDQDTGHPVRLNGTYPRDEAGQARYLDEVLETFDTAGVDSTFVFLFALDHFPHRPDGDPRDDLDRASPAIVKSIEGRRGDTYPDMTWEPKAAFAAVAERYGSPAVRATPPPPP